MSKPNDNIYKLYYEARSICLSHRCNKWKNFWMWGNQNLQTGYKNLKYYFLIWLESDGTFHYDDINEVSIVVEYNKKYRIDISTYSEKFFWEFEEKNWQFVSAYIKKVIQHQYDSIEGLNSIISLTKDAYSDVEPKQMYDAINKSFRKTKLKKIKSLNKHENK